jgi:hypothetical protein
VHRAAGVSHARTADSISVRHRRPDGEPRQLPGADSVSDVALDEMSDAVAHAVATLAESSAH